MKSDAEACSRHGNTDEKVKRKRVRGMKIMMKGDAETCSRRGKNDKK